MCHALYAFLHMYRPKWIIRIQGCCSQSWKAAVNCLKRPKFGRKDEYCSATIFSECHVTIKVLWWQDSHSICIACHKSLSAWREDKWCSTNIIPRRKGRKTAATREGSQLGQLAVATGVRLKDEWTPKCVQDSSELQGIFFSVEIWW